MRGVFKTKGNIQHPRSNEISPGCLHPTAGETEVVGVLWFRGNVRFISEV